MKKIKIPPYIRSNNPLMARWQSVVASVARENIEKEHPDFKRDKINGLVMKHPMVLGTNLHIKESKGEERKLSSVMIEDYLPTKSKKLNIHPMVHAYLSQEHFDKMLEVLNKPQAPNLDDISTHLITSPIEFPDSDYAYAQWAKCAIIWAKYGNPDPSPYVNAHGGAESNFGVYTIPSNSKIIILGDFGTGLNDATTMLIAIMQQLSPDFIIHLGDIYYSGTEDECKTFVGTFDKAFKASGKKVPVFSIPGNHEYYSGGSGFFESVMTMNKKNGFGNFDQKASFFSLRTIDNNWQLLGMDTGYNSVHNFNIVHPTQLNASYAPWLEFGEAAWHQNKLENFSGKTILLSHHQLYSSNAIINDGKGVSYQTGTNKGNLSYLNGNILAVFKPYFSKVAAWFWGHEHTLNVFKSNQIGLAKGRLIGNSGYEEWAGEDPYKPTNSPYHDLTPSVEVGTTPVRWLGSSYDFLNHGFTLLNLDGENTTANYFQYPVFSPNQSIPSNPPKIMRVRFKDQPL